MFLCCSKRPQKDMAKHAGTGNTCFPKQLKPHGPECIGQNKSPRLWFATMFQTQKVQSKELKREINIATLPWESNDPLIRFRKTNSEVSAKAGPMARSFFRRRTWFPCRSPRGHREPAPKTCTWMFQGNHFVGWFKLVTTNKPAHCSGKPIEPNKLLPVYPRCGATYLPPINKGT